MLHRDILNAYMQSYREYMHREADKYRELKFISDSRDRFSGSADQTPSPTTPAANSAGISWKPRLAQIVHSVRTIFRPDQPCETC